MNEKLEDRLASALEKREIARTKRILRVNDPNVGMVNLANNDYLGLSMHPRLREAGRNAIDEYGCSSSASPLITGYGPTHDRLLNTLKYWHGFEHGVVWNSGYVANQALLSSLPQKGDLVLADRLIHNSIISGVLSSGARLIRYRHCDLAHLESLLEEYSTKGRLIFVVTESVFSMDGDYPDLKYIAGLKERFEFYWILDEAHALGWYGDRGSGLAEEFGIVEQVDALVGTLGKALGSMGAYTLFREESVAEYLLNFSGEFIYSTYLPPACAAIADTAISIVSDSKGLRKKGRENSLKIRRRLAELRYSVIATDSPIISIPMGCVKLTMDAACKLESARIRVGAVRPPTVPEGTSRLRVSLRAGMSEELIEKLIGALAEMVGRR